MAELVLMVGW